MLAAHNKRHEQLQARYGAVPVTRKEQDAIYAYLNLNKRGGIPRRVPAIRAGTINEALRSRRLGANTEMQEVVGALDRVFAKSATLPLPAVRRVFRGVDSANLRGWQIGGVRRFRGYLSTSHDKGRALFYAGRDRNILSICFQRPTPFIFSQFEDEVVLPRNTAVQLLAVKDMIVDKSFFLPHYDIAEQVVPVGSTFKCFECVVV